MGCSPFFLFILLLFLELLGVVRDVLANVFRESRRASSAPPSTPNQPWSSRRGSNPCRHRCSGARSKKEKKKENIKHCISFGYNNIYKLQSIKVFPAQSLIVASALFVSFSILSWQFQKILIFARCILIFLSHTYTHNAFNLRAAYFITPDTGYRRALQLPYRIMQPTIMAMAVHIKWLRKRQARYCRVIRYHLRVTFLHPLLETGFWFTWHLYQFWLLSTLLALITHSQQSAHFRLECHFICSVFFRLILHLYCLDHNFIYISSI